MSENYNFKFVQRNFFVIIGKLISVANFYKITKKNLACYKTRNSKNKRIFFYFLPKW